MAKQELKNEVAKKTSTLPDAYVERPSVVDSADIIVPKILLAQGLSESVAAGRAKMGDFTNSMTGVVVGSVTQPITFIPITLKKYWKKFEYVGNKRQFRGTEPFTPANRNRPLQENLPSQQNPSLIVKWENDLVIDLFGFTEDDVQDPVALPAAVSFTRTSYKTGQKVSTHFASLDAAIGAPVPYYAYMLTLSCAKKQNDKGIFYVFDVGQKFEGSKACKTPVAYMPKIERWSKILSDSSRNVVIDDADEAEETVIKDVDSSRF